MRRCLMALAVSAVLWGAGVAQAANSATVSGTLTGARLPKAADGGAFVTAVSLKDWSIVGATRVAPSGRYTLKVPKGDYALSSTLVSRVATLQNAFPVRLRAGQRLRRPLTLKRTKKKRKRARGSGVNKYGYSYPGTAVGVEYFRGATGELAVLNKGLANILDNDLIPYSAYGDRSAGCTLSVVEWMHRQDLVDEIELSHTKWVDPKTALSGRKLIDPDLLVGGDIAVSGPASNPTLTVTARVTDTKTGAVLGTTTLQTTGRGFFDDIGRLADQVTRLLCHPPPKDTPPPPPPPPPPTLPNVYKVDVSVTSTFDNQGGVTAHGTISATLMVQRSAESPSGRVTYTGTGQMAFSDVTGTYPDCTFNSAQSTPVSWTVNLEAYAILRKVTVLSWVPNQDQNNTILSFDCPTDPFVRQGLGPWLLSVEPNDFELPVGGGTKQVSGGSSLDYTNIGTVTLTPQ